MDIEKVRAEEITYVFSEDEVVHALFEVYLRTRKDEGKARLWNFHKYELEVVVNDGGFHHTISEARVSIVVLDEETKE